MILVYATTRFFSNPGRAIRPVYKLRFTRSVPPELVQVDTEDWLAYIQSFKDGCSLTAIVKRFENGDSSGLNLRAGFYGDVSDLPSDPYGFRAMGAQVSRTFDNLPSDIRNKFSSIDEFADTAGTKAWYEKLGVKFESHKDEKEGVKDAAE